MSILESILRGFFGAGLASAGFAILFNIRGKNILLAGLTGAVGGLVYNLSVYFGIHPVLANFYAVLALASVSELLARMENCTVSTFMACGLIPLVPGGDAYRMMVQLINGKVYAGLQYGLTMVAIAGMLVLGILVVSTLTRLVLFLKKRMLTKPAPKHS